MNSYQHVKKFLLVFSLLFVFLRGGFSSGDEKSAATGGQSGVPDKLEAAPDKPSSETPEPVSSVPPEEGLSENGNVLPQEVIFPETMPGESYRPYLWIDCEKQGGVFEQKCFTQIKLVTARMLESGEFAGVRSLSHLQWLYSADAGVAPVSFAEFPPYQNPKMKAFAMRVHHSDLVQLADRSGRYALIWVEYPAGRALSDVKEADRREWREMLELYKLPHRFAHDGDFLKQMRGFYPYLGVLHIEGVGMAPDDPAYWEFFYRLERRLYAIKGVKLLYSPRHTLRSLSLVMSMKTGDKASLAGLLSVWELAGEYGSLRLNPEKNRYDIAIYGEPSAGLNETVAGASEKFFQKSGARWEIVWAEEKKSLAAGR